jgi:hypothetical protein
MLSVAGPQESRGRVDNWRIKTDLEGSGRGPIEVISQHLLGRTEEIYKNFSGVPAEIRTRYLSKTNQEIYQYSNALSAVFGVCRKGKKGKLSV